MSYSKKILSLSLLIAASFYSVLGNAAEHTLATITNDVDTNSYVLVIDSSDGDREVKAFYKDTFSKGKRILRESFDYRSLNSGMILMKQDKYIVMKLQSNNFDNQQGGMMNLDTLVNGASGSRKSYALELSKDKTGWILLNQNKTVKQIFIQSNKVMVLGVVGIKNITMK